jgi:glyoxylate reductase
MAKPKVFVTREIPEPGLSMVREACEAEVWPGELPPPYEVLLEKVRDIDGLLCLLTDRIDENLLANAPRLKVVSNMAVGYDNIDVAAATRRGIAVGNTPGVLTDTTADFAWALLMAAARNVVIGDRFVRAGKWKTWGPKLLLGQDVHHATLGLIGLGRIGSEVARRAQGFSMRVLYYDVFRREDLERQLNITYTDLDTLLRESDFVSIHTPLTPETRHLINRENLAKMKRTAVLVNTARGPIVDTMALYEALRDGVIWAAGLDVTDPEPIPVDHPLLTLENVVIAPHIASASFATRSKMSEIAARNLLAGLKGEPLPAFVNPEAYQNRRSS